MELLMEHRVKGLETKVGEHDVLIAVMKSEIQETRNIADKLLAKVDEFTKIMYDIRAQLASQAAKTTANKWVIGLAMTAAGGVIYLILDKLIKGT